MSERSMPGLGACLHPDRHRRWRVLCAPGAGAAGQANGDMAAAVVGRAQGERQAAQRSGGLGRPAATTLVGHDCIDPKAIAVELRVRFIDLLMAFEVKLVKPLC